jgi:hypothetical protein
MAMVSEHGGRAGRQKNVITYVRPKGTVSP